MSYLSIAATVFSFSWAVVGSYQGTDLIGPSWYWNPWQWPLNAWPNLVVTGCAFVGWVYIAVRLDRTWLEFVWPRFDTEICRMLRKWVGGQATDDWSDKEGRLIRWTYLLVTTAVLLGCVVAAAMIEPAHR
jgi:hypothetical protein